MARSLMTAGLGALAVALLAGCGLTGSGHSAQGPAAPTSSVAASTPTSPGASATPTSSGTADPADAPTADAPAGTSSPQCSGLTGAQALDQWGPGIGVWGQEDQGWALDLDNADTNNYDPCAALSWIVVGIRGATASSPTHIMLFHHGQYTGLASAQMIGFPPQVVRLDDASVQVTYTWTRDGEITAEASGRSVSVFTWDDASQSVVHSGQWPPEVQQ